MSNENNGVAVPISNDFTGGPIYLPSGASNGKDVSVLLNEAVKRLVNHDHSGKDSVKATLPQSASEIFPTATYLIVQDAAQSDLFQITMRLATITPNLSNVSFYYRLNSEPAEDASWKRFYPQYVVNNVEALRELTITGLIRDDIQIKVSA